MTKYQKIIKTYLKDFAKRKPANLPDIEVQVISDTENNHFQLAYVGWQGNRFIYSILFHLDIKNGKVLIQKNATERLVDEDLIKNGVAKEDVIFGFVDRENLTEKNLAA